MFALCSGYGTIKAESFEKEVLMLSSTERVFPWNKYFDHLKNFILLATDSVSMQAFFFCFFSQKRTFIERKLRSREFLTCIQVFLKALFSFRSSSHKWKVSKFETSHFFQYQLILLEAGCSCFSKSLIKMKKLTWIYIFTLLIGPSKSFMDAVKAFIKLVETPQRNLKIKNQVNFFFRPGLE